MIEYVTVGGIVTFVIAISGWLLLHTRNHPNKEDIGKGFSSLDRELDKLKGPDGMQWKDLCNERTKRIETSIKAVDDKVVVGFRELKGLIKDSRG